MTEPWQPDIDFDEERARALVEAQFPELAPARLEVLGRGWDNLALLVNGEWVFRFPQRELAGDLMRHEVAALGAIAGDLPLAVPEPSLVGRPEGDYPHVFCGYRMLEGRTACSVDPVTVADEANARAVGEFLRALHGVEPARELPGDLIRRADLEYRLERVLEKLAAIAPTVPDVDVEALGVAARELARTSPWGGEPRLVHGDLYARHLLVDREGRVSGVIDWGDVHRGDPALDLSIAYGFFPAVLRGAFEEAYGGVDEATGRRARFRAILYGALLSEYGAKVGDSDVSRLGRWALQNALD